MESLRLFAPAESEPGPVRQPRSSRRVAVARAEDVSPSTQLTFSDVARPAIVLEVVPIASRSPASVQIDLTWWPVPVSLKSISRVVDGLIVMAAVLIFSVLAISWTKLFPSWWVAGGVALGVGMTFAVVYVALFRGFGDKTPGRRLAEFAVRQPADTEAERTRFR